MLTHPTLDQLNVLGLHGMAKAFKDLADDDETSGLGHVDWLALLLDREAVHRQDKRLSARLRVARLRHNAAPEDIDYRSTRGLDRRLLQEHIKGDWIGAHDNLVITGPTGVGKSWLACALGHKACRDNHAVIYVRAPKLFDELALAHAHGSAGRRLKSLAATKLLILDDWGLEPLSAQGCHDLLEILEDRYGRGSTLVTSQLPVADWHTVIGEATYADAILDRSQRPPARTRRRLDATDEIHKARLTGRHDQRSLKTPDEGLSPGGDHLGMRWRHQIGIAWRHRRIRTPSGTGVKEAGPTV